MVVLLLVARRRNRGALAEAARPEAGSLSPTEEARLKRLMNAREI
jgi:hypothetical protein